MFKNHKSAQVPPPVVTLVAATHSILGIVVFVLCLLQGLMSLKWALDQKSNLLAASCLGLLWIAAALWGGGFMLWTAFAFYNLDPRVYPFMRAVAVWNPRYWLFTRFGHRLDDEDVLAAFGLGKDANNKVQNRHDDPSAQA